MQELLACLLPFQPCASSRRALCAATCNLSFLTQLAVVLGNRGTALNEVVAAGYSPLLLHYPAASPAAVRGIEGFAAYVSFSWSFRVAAAPHSSLLADGPFTLLQGL